MPSELFWQGSRAPVAPRPARLADPVIWDLCDQIVGSRLLPTALLPSEPELTAWYGVSRTVVREAVQSLQERGLVQIKQGQGTRVLAESSWNLLDPVVLEATVRHDEDLSILDDLVEVRVALESQMAARTAMSRNAADLELLRELLERLGDALGDPAKYWGLDAEFHDAFMITSGNRLARAVVGSIHEKARGSTRYNGSPDQHDMELGHRGHVAIYEAILAGDPEQAAQAVRDHIFNSWLRRKAARPKAKKAPHEATRRLASGKAAAPAGGRSNRS